MEVLCRWSTIRWVAEKESRSDISVTFLMSQLATSLYILIKMGRSWSLVRLYCLLWRLFMTGFENNLLRYVSKNSMTGWVRRGGDGGNLCIMKLTQSFSWCDVSFCQMSSHMTTLNESMSSFSMCELSLRDWETMSVVQFWFFDPMMVKVGAGREGLFPKKADILSDSVSRSWCKLHVSDWSLI